MSCKQDIYKRLGDYIREVDVRNADLKVSKLVGLTIAKAFIPSVANTIGTDLSKYKIIKENQFACSLMQVSRDGKMPIAIYKGEDAIMSPAYPVFEVYKDGLLPDYLQMWFSRSEFDREAVFYAVGGVRGSLDWDDFMDMKLPIPTLDVQRRIVSRYQAIQGRIAGNKQTIAKLEEAAQALYRKMFVDDIDVENLPEGWRRGTLGEVADFAYGKMPNRDKGGVIPIFSGYAITGYTNECSYDKSHIIVIARGDAGSGKVCLSPDRFFLTNLAIAVLLKHEAMKYYLYYHLCSLDTSILRSGSAQAQVTINSLLPFEIMIPSIVVCEKFDSLIEPMRIQMKLINKENEKLTEMLSVVMA